jgi:hypothetical protein
MHQATPFADKIAVRNELEVQSRRCTWRAAQRSRSIKRTALVDDDSWDPEEGGDEARPIVGGIRRARFRCGGSRPPDSTRFMGPVRGNHHDWQS